jgi:(E)-4-hydroxy-3-methylbut-2-enyl-diphosphate synthase
MVTTKFEMTLLKSYCHSRFQAQRRYSTEVMVGNIGVGGSNPIRIQSMTTTATQDVAATVKQCIVLAEAGCEIIRITAQNIKAAMALKEIQKAFRQAGFKTPLVADIHFLPAVAMEAVKHVEKIRINPGNYADKKSVSMREYSDSEYTKALERLHDLFTPLVKECKAWGRALRIGTNHGSLSDRIMSRYGDTPLGMTESALEFIRICKSYGFKDIMLSMKASNPRVMIEAYRLLVKRMLEEGMHYPLHLGVTEAGDGQEGIIKSTIGIGSLLLDGLGDTLRVSLTGDPVEEIPIARSLIRKASLFWGKHEVLQDNTERSDEIDPYVFNQRKVNEVNLRGWCKIGANEPPSVMVYADEVTGRMDINGIAERIQLAEKKLNPLKIEALLFNLASNKGLHKLASLQRSLKNRMPFTVLELKHQISWEKLRELKDWDEIPTSLMIVRSFSKNEGQLLHEIVGFTREKGFLLALDILPDDLKELACLLPNRKDLSHLVVTCSLTAENMHSVGTYRKLASVLKELDCNWPIWIRNTALNCIEKANDRTKNLLEAAMLIGSLLCDGLGDIVSVETDPDMADAASLVYSILQGASARRERAEFIACPGCGRTLFDIQATTRSIREQTQHLKGLKIAVMGCVVNGPGEMADADFGYVGGSSGKVNLYVGRQCVRHHVPEELAVNELIELIKSEGKWRDPQTDFKRDLKNV